MKTALGLTAALFLVTLMAPLDVASASGSGPKSGSSHGSGGYRSFSHNGHSYHTHYYGHNYRGWSQYCWYPSYRCYGYYCPTQSCWYYYCGQQQCYLPVSYMSTFAPTPTTNVNANANANANTNTNVNINAGGGVALPPGGTQLPVGVGPQLQTANK